MSKNTFNDSPHIFVAAKRYQIKFPKSTMDVHDVEGEEDGHNLYDEPDECCTCLHPKLLRGKPTPHHKKQQGIFKNTSYTVHLQA